MFKRLFWFVMGVLARVFGLRYAKNKAKDAAADFSVADLATDLFGLLVKLVNYVVDLVREVMTKTDQSSTPRN